MDEIPDYSNVVIRPPLAWALAISAGFVIDAFLHLPFVPPTLLVTSLGGAIFALGFFLAIWAVVTIRRAGTNIETSKPTRKIVSSGPFSYMRNPVYTGMFLGEIGLAVAFSTLWLLIMLAPFYLVIRYGVVAREEAYLERKFGQDYLDYKSRVPRWPWS
jgi:protein-S-isoprenylcysteine O-methyltransferase Ste14